MDDFKQYREQVKEILDFVDSGELLSGFDSLHEIDAKIISTLDQIPTEDDYFEAGYYYSWDDINSLASRKCYTIEMEKFPKNYPYNRFLSIIHDELWEKLKSRFSQEYKEIGIDCYVVGFLETFIHCRLVMGAENSFFEDIFRVYKAGGYPCGWEGKYPEGRLIVFNPKEK